MGAPELGVVLVMEVVMLGESSEHDGMEEGQDDAVLGESQELDTGNMSGGMSPIGPPGLPGPPNCPPLGPPIIPPGGIGGLLPIIGGPLGPPGIMPGEGTRGGPPKPIGGPGKDWLLLSLGLFGEGPIMCGAIILCCCPCIMFFIIFGYFADTF